MVLLIWQIIRMVDPIDETVQELTFMHILRNQGYRLPQKYEVDDRIRGKLF